MKKSQVRLLRTKHKAMPSKANPAKRRSAVRQESLQPQTSARYIQSTADTAQTASKLKGGARIIAWRTD